MKSSLIPKLAAIVDDNELKSMNWELQKDTRPYRFIQKKVQFVVDLSIFAISPIVAIIAFLLDNTIVEWYQYSLIVAEMLVIGLLVFQFALHSKPK